MKVKNVSKFIIMLIVFNFIFSNTMYLNANCEYVIEVDPSSNNKEIAIVFYDNSTMNCFPLQVYICTPTGRFVPTDMKVNAKDKKIVETNISPNGLLTLCAKSTGETSIEITVRYDSITVIETYVVKSLDPKFTNSDPTEYGLDHLYFNNIPRTSISNNTSFYSSFVKQHTINFTTQALAYSTKIQNFWINVEEFKPYVWGAKLKVRVDTKYLPKGHTVIGIIDIIGTDNRGRKSTVIRLMVIVDTIGKKIIEAKIGQKPVYINGSKFEFGDNEIPFISKDRTYIPLRFISEHADMIVEFNDDTKSIVITSNNIQLSIPPPNASGYFMVSRTFYKLETKSDGKTGNCCYSREDIAPPKDFILTDQKTGKRFILARFLFETFGGYISWYKEVKRLILVYEPGWVY